MIIDIELVFIIGVLVLSILEICLSYLYEKKSNKKWVDGATERIWKDRSKWLKNK